MSKTWQDIYDFYPDWFSELIWGFECDLGWHELIKGLVQEIYFYYATHHPSMIDDFKVTQIKEKYGTLRFYVYGADEHIFDLIEEAEDTSGSICEVCGEPGKVQDIGGQWYKCVCDEHLNKIRNLK